MNLQERIEHLEQVVGMLTVTIEESRRVLSAVDRALGTHRGAQLAVECFAKALAAHLQPKAPMLATFDRALETVSANTLTFRLSDAAHEACEQAMRDTAEVFRRELAAP